MTGARRRRRQRRGSRNAEFLPSLAVALNGFPKIHAIVCDTDGIDGSEDNGRALYQPDSIAPAAALGLRANVNDFRAILAL